MSDLTKQSELKELADRLEPHEFVFGDAPVLVKAVDLRNAAYVIRNYCAALRSPPSAGVRGALEEIDGCFQAAYAEGLSDRLAEAEQSPGSLVDLFLRRIVFAHHAAINALSDHGVQIRAGIEPSPAVIESLKSGIERQRDDGFWRSCSGCFETVDGYSSQPVDEIFNCQLGCGCRECGGIGAVWDNTDYDDMVSFMLAEDEADERNERIRKALEFYADPFKSQFTY